MVPSLRLDMVSRDIVGRNNGFSFEFEFAVPVDSDDNESNAQYQDGYTSNDQGSSINIFLQLNKRFQVVLFGLAGWTEASEDEPEDKSWPRKGHQFGPSQHQRMHSTPATKKTGNNLS